MDEGQIVSEAINLAVQAAKKSVTEKGKPIGFHDLYDETVSMAEAISYHSVKGVFPKKLFSNRSPNETEAEAKYIEANYKQFTLPVFVDYIATITRPYGEGNWNIEYKEDSEVFKTANKTFKQYVENEIPLYGSIEYFKKFIVPAVKSRDANGFIAIRPTEIPLIQNEQGEIVVDSQELYKPMPFIFESKDVLNYTESYYLFLSTKTSPVTFNGSLQNVGTVYELYTRDSVYMIEQYGKKSDHTFRAIPFYRHSLNEFPVIQLMGIPNLVNGKILWQSPFLFATDLLDLVAVNRNWLQASINKCVFPHVVMYGSPCEYKNENGSICNNGIIEGFNNEMSTCTRCQGSGLKSRLSPLGTLLINPKRNSINESDDSSTLDPLKFVSPDVTTLEFINKKAEGDEEKARSILKLRSKNSQAKTSNDVTATEIFDDAKSMTAFVKPISDQTFTIYEFILRMIGLQRYGESFEPPALSYPKTFDFKTPEDYLLDIQNAQKAGNLPPAFIQLLLMQYINAFFSDNEKTLAIFKLVIEADRLFGLSNDEINMRLSKGTVYKWESILHDSILTFIRTSLDNDQNFLTKQLPDQITALIELAKAKEDEGEAMDIYADQTQPIIE